MGFSQNRKSLEAVRTNSAPEIDGNLTEEMWKSASAGTSFLQKEPRPGNASTLSSEVKIIYDDAAIYIGAFLKEVHRDSVLRELGRRDTEGNTDLFGVFLDTYNDDLNAFGFFVTAAGVQVDAKYSSEGQDFNWNAVWESAVKIRDDGWYVEMRIPYSAIRFSSQAIQTWGVNFIRKIRRKRETVFWNYVDPAKDGLVNQSGDLTGLTNIESPLRLSVSPYISAYAENYPYNIPARSNNTYSLRGGLDLKYGISEAFTLDMTLVPDFGQVQSDNLVLNLSPFEIKFNENRPFFTEGTELFNKGNLFYSRRIGARPIRFSEVYYQLNEGEYVVSNPTESQLINATKISGRTRSNMGIGLFNATTAEMYATVSDSSGNSREILTSPLTNFNVMVFDQALKNNSFVTLINTNVTRNGGMYDANVTGTVFNFANKENSYSVSGRGVLTQKYYEEPVFGHSYYLRAGKISGNLMWSLDGGVQTDTYDPNDLGIQFMNNTIDAGALVEYNIYKPFWKVNHLYSSMRVTYTRMYNPNKFANFGISAESFTTFTKRFLTTGGWFGLEPIITYDFYEPRVLGRFYTYPINATAGYWFSSDYRKRFALDGRVRYRIFDENERMNIAFGLSPRYRFSDKLLLTYDFDRDNFRDDIGFVSAVNDSIFFGRRNVQTVYNTLETRYTFNNRMSVSLRARHYWSKAKYLQYYFLDEEGMLLQSDYNNDHDINFNAFNVDMVYAWQFAPGSEMTIVWKNAILGVDRTVVNNYVENVDKTFSLPQRNSFSIKVLYFIDYLNVVKRVR